MFENYVQSGLIEAEDFLPLLDHPDVYILDASLPPPGQAGNCYSAFLRSHIPGSQFFDIKAISDQGSPFPHMLPSPSVFEQAVRRLGIGNDDLVVIYGQAGMVMGPARAWWMFRVFGHQNVCLLNGGLPAWKAAGYALSDENSAPPPPQSSEFEAVYSTDLVCDLDSMGAFSENSDNVLILDARSRERFGGGVQEPRPGLRSGHIPGSCNLPCVELIDPQTSKMKSRENLLEILQDHGYVMDRKTVTTCGSGVTACVIALALYMLGERNVPVYDGSWSEWGLESSGMLVESLG